MTRRNSQMGPLSKNTAASPHFFQRVELEPPTRVCNSMVREPLNLKKEWAGCPIHPSRLVAFDLPSKGQSC